LIPVKASVFDDDFFQASSMRGEPGSEEGVAERYRVGTHFSSPGRVQEEEVRLVTEEVFPLEASVRVPTMGGAAAVAADPAEPDELDIPAFLRRGN
jgi:cell division protein FtsZ